MSDRIAASPEVHYDNVSRAWRYLMGESFHYGFFRSPDLDLVDATRALTGLLADRGRIEAGHHVLDVGCGIGAPARQLARELACRVTGISTSEVGIAIAREMSAAEGLLDLTAFEVRDGMRNGFDAGAFDRVWVMESSHLMPDKPAMLREAARVLRPGGRLVLCDIVARRDLPIAEVVSRARSFDLLRRVFGRAKMETLVSYRGWLEELGFEAVRSEDITSETAPTFDRWQENADRHRDAVGELIGERNWEEFHRSCDTLRTMWRDGLLGYGVIKADKAH